MNQNCFDIRLRDFMENDDGWGREQGRKLKEKLLNTVEANSGKTIFRISLDGVKRTDASFPRESVIDLAKRYRGQKGFYLVDVKDEDLLDNWEAAALKREQPLFVWSGDSSRLIGLRPSSGLKEVLEYALAVPRFTATLVSEKLSLKLANASTKLKQLVDTGFLLRREETANSGGVEYVYFRIK